MCLPEPLHEDARGCVVGFTLIIKTDQELESRKISARDRINDGIDFLAQAFIACRKRFRLERAQRRELPPDGSPGEIRAHRVIQEISHVPSFADGARSKSPVQLFVEILDCCIHLVAFVTQIASAATPQLRWQLAGTRRKGDSVREFTDPCRLWLASQTPPMSRMSSDAEWQGDVADERSYVPVLLDLVRFPHILAV